MLTAKGRKKLQDAQRVARQALQTRLRIEALATKKLAAAFAPSEAEEAELLSRGESVETGQVVGTPSGGRFERGGYASLGAAIEEDDITMLARGPVVVAETGHPSRINERTGFYWGTRSRGRQGPTLPFDEHYVEAMEFGGIWIVIPRGPWGLEPEDGFTTMRMDKTLPPRRMFGNARRQHEPVLRVGVQSSLSAAVRAVGLA
jgi:hypothetical protein